MNRYRNHLHKKICTLFLNTVFVNPNFIKGELSKYLELPTESVQFGKPTETDESITIPLAILFDDGKEEFTLIFSKRVEKPKEIEVPKVVPLKRHWWQEEQETKVIVEKHETKERPYFLLTSIK